MQNTEVRIRSRTSSDEPWFTRPETIRVDFSCFAELVQAVRRATPYPIIWIGIDGGFSDPLSLEPAVFDQQIPFLQVIQTRGVPAMFLGVQCCMPLGGVFRASIQAHICTVRLDACEAEFWTFDELLRAVIAHTGVRPDSISIDGYPTTLITALTFEQCMPLLNKAQWLLGRIPIVVHCSAGWRI